MKVVEETFRQLLQKVLCLWRKQIFVYIDEDFAKIEFVLNFQVFYWQVKFVWAWQNGVVSKNIRKRCISRSSKAVHNIKLPLTYSEFTVHMQNHLKAGSSVGTRAGLSRDVIFFLLCTCYEMNGFEMTLLAQRTSESGANSIIFEQAIRRFNNWIRAVQYNFLSDILDLVYLRFA